MPESYTDDTGNRVIIRHKGPAGIGLPSGGAVGQVLVKKTGADFATEWRTPTAAASGMTGPNGAPEGHVPVFDGTSGKVLKNSGVVLSALATAASVALKQDAVANRQLSQENFTLAEKEKLGLLTRHFRGTFTDLTQLSTFNFGLTPPVTGDYAIVNDTNTTVPSKLYVWDSRAPGRWTQPSAAFLGSDVATALFAGGDVWSQSTCRIFTSAEKAMVAAHDSIISSIPGLASSAKAYGSLKYFDTSGGTSFYPTAMTTTGNNNTYPLTLATSLGTETSGFTSNNLGRLTHTGNIAKVFQVIANLTCEVAATHNVAFSLAKNGSVVSDSLKFTKLTAPTSSDVTVIGHVQLGLNDYVEIYFGNITTMASLSITSMSVSIVEV